MVDNETITALVIPPRTLVDLVKSPTSLVFSSIFISIAFFCTAGNALAIYVMHKTRGSNFSTRLPSSWILFHLALAGVLMGAVWSTVCGIQLLSADLRGNATLEEARRILGIVLPGAFICLIGCISYDRYILLKYNSNHGKYMTKRKTAILISLCWILPISVQALRLINPTAFYLFVLAVIFAVFFIVVVAYVCIIKLVFESELKMKRSALNTPSLPVLSAAGKRLSTVSNSESLAKLGRTIKLAKTVSCLILTYLFFHLSTVVYLSFRVVQPNLMNETNKQIILLVNECMSQMNALLNPCIYFMTCEAYMRGVKKFCLRPLSNAAASFNETSNVYKMQSPMSQSKQMQSSPTSNSKLSPIMNQSKLAISDGTRLSPMTESRLSPMTGMKQK